MLGPPNDAMRFVLLLSDSRRCKDYSLVPGCHRVPIQSALCIETPRSFFFLLVAQHTRRRSQSKLFRDRDS